MALRKSIGRTEWIFLRADRLEAFCASQLRAAQLARYKHSVGSDIRYVLAIVAADQSNPVTEVPRSVRLEVARQRDEVAEHLPNADAVVLWEFSPLLEQEWRSGLSLSWVHVAGSGVDSVLFPALVESPVTLTNSRGVFDEPVAEYAVALVCAIAKRVGETIALQAASRWRHRQSDRLAGSRVVIVGPGGIGRAIARKLKGLGMIVVGVGRSIRDEDEDFDAIAVVTELPELVARAKFVVVAAPLTKETLGLFDHELFEHFSGASLVNVARGEIVHENALLDALNAGRVESAALDVFSTEPLSLESPLWSHPNVIVSPHMAGDVPEIMDDLVKVWMQNLQRWLAGQPLMNVVDKELSFVPR